MIRESSTIGIIGLGFVGNAIFQKFKTKFKIVHYDIKEHLSNSSIIEISEKTDIVFVCLPTPSSPDGQCDLTSIKIVLEELNDYMYQGVIVIKSTIIPGSINLLSSTFTNLRLVHNPEFLREKSAVNDFSILNKIILGGKKNDTTQAKNFYLKIFPSAKIYETDSKTSEMVKYFINTFLATKVCFANEMFEFCKSLDINYKKLLELVITDQRISPSHFNVPGHDGKFGFGGSCLPKDITALKYFGDKINIDTKITSAVIKKNKSVRKKS